MGGLGLGLRSTGGGSGLITSINSVFVGQSIANFAFNDPAFTDTDAGVTAFQTGVEAQGLTFDRAVDAAKAGIAIRDANAGAAGAYLTAAGEKSSDYDTLIGSVTDKNDVNLVIITIGNTDAVGIEDGSSTKAETKASFETFIDFLEGDFPNAVVAIVPLGADTNSTDFSGYREYGEIEAELIEAGTVKRLPSYLVGPYRDDTHLSETGATNQWNNIGQAAAVLVNGTEQGELFGPRITEVLFGDGESVIYLKVDGSLANVDDQVLKSGSVSFTKNGGGVANPGFTVVNNSGVDNTDPFNGADYITLSGSGISFTSGDEFELLIGMSTWRNTTLTTEVAQDSSGRALQKDVINATAP